MKITITIWTHLFYPASFVLSLAEHARFYINQKKNFYIFINYPSTHLHHRYQEAHM